MAINTECHLYNELLGRAEFVSEPSWYGPSWQVGRVDQLPWLLGDINHTHSIIFGSDGLMGDYQLLDIKIQFIPGLNWK